MQLNVMQPVALGSQARQRGGLVLCVAMQKQIVAPSIDPKPDIPPHPSSSVPSPSRNLKKGSLSPLVDPPVLSVTASLSRSVGEPGHSDLIIDCLGGPLMSDTCCTFLTVTTRVLLTSDICDLQHWLDPWSTDIQDHS